MMYLYHKVPSDLKGSILYPLNELRSIYPELYTKKMEKYEGREDIMQIYITELDCFWNDAIHLTPVHPDLVKKALIEAGRQEELSFQCYEIDPSTLEPERAVIFKSTMSTDNDELSQASNFVPFSSDVLKEYSEIPEISKEYYRNTLAAGSKPFLFRGIPHILYKGRLDVSGIKIITI
jgi:hypothetical protein